MTSLLVRLLAFLLLAEALFAGVRVAGFVPRLGGYDLIAMTLILARCALGALQFTAGWLLATRRPQGPALGQAAFVGAAVLTVFDVGFGLAPTGVYAWLRWQVTLCYVAYAIAAAVFLKRLRESAPCADWTPGEVLGREFGTLRRLRSV